MLVYGPLPPAPWMADVSTVDSYDLDLLRILFMDFGEKVTPVLLLVGFLFLFDILEAFLFNKTE